VPAPNEVLSAGGPTSDIVDEQRNGSEMICSFARSAEKIEAPPLCVSFFIEISPLLLMLVCARFALTLLFREEPFRDRLFAEENLASDGGPRRADSLRVPPRKRPRGDTEPRGKLPLRPIAFDKSVLAAHVSESVIKHRKRKCVINRQLRRKIGYTAVTSGGIQRSVLRETSMNTGSATGNRTRV
jgi:hypothetical protein